MSIVGCASVPNDATAMPATPTSSADARLQAILRSVLDDARQRSAPDAGRVKVVQAQSVVWPDGALGCPLPGRLYTQALVPGYRIRVEAGTQVLDYHASASGQWLLCPLERSVAPLPDDRR